MSDFLEIRADVSFMPITDLSVRNGVGSLVTLRTLKFMLAGAINRWQSLSASEWVR